MVVGAGENDMLSSQVTAKSAAGLALELDLNNTKPYRFNVGRQRLTTTL